MVKHVARSTKTLGQLLDLDDSGAVLFTMPCRDMVWASAAVVLRQGTGSAFVLTVVVSNDASDNPPADTFINHPGTVTLTNSAKVTAAFNVVGYMHFGVKLTTVNAGNLLADVYLAAKDSPV